MSNHVRDKQKFDTVELYSVLSSNGRLRYISSNCLDCLGYAQEELIGRDVREYIHKDDIYLLESFFYNDHHLSPCSFRFRHKKGVYIWMEATVDFIHNRLKENEREVVIKLKMLDSYISSQPTKGKNPTIQDTSISDLKVLEDAYILIEKLPSPLFISVDGVIQYVNTSLLGLLGAHSKEEVVGKSIYDLILAPYHEVVRKRIQLLHQDKQVGMIEQVWRRTDGRFIDVECRPSLIEYKGKKAELVAIHDVSSRKRVQNKLQKSRERYQRLIQNSIDTIAVIHKDKWVFMNESGLKLFGVGDYSAIIGKNIYSFLEREHHVHMRKALAEIIEGKKDTVLMNQSWNRHAEKGAVFTEIVCLPTTYFGEPAVQVIIRDLTERKHTEELMLQSEKLTIAGQLAAGIAHEIRNPLTAIKGFLQLMQAEKDENDQYFDIIFSELNRIELILSELLLLAKPQQAIMKKVNMNHVLTEVMTLLETEANLNNVMIEKSLCEDCGDIYCDPNQLKQVFINLIKNSIEAMPNGGSVSIITYTEHDQFVIHVKDTGTGIPEDILQKIGQPFVTTKESGNGLGLMMTFKMVENHHGTINVRSKEGEGTTFTIKLPYS
ncbi:PAS domain S-box protein [Bacillus sp. FJAT-47783]|uniref:PAS domain S-box protein n=1 Tax=Bacillus sp. FJAT-47783 TaxID=2922712 RepID=UPI001FACA555|nr:PAS domain S-box protein [Bacillus sp. FJAT-47783]